MKLLRKLLFPFSSLYWIITSIRNFLYDKTIFKSYAFDIPIIAVGNLSVGGTGKTPQIEYLIRLLSNQYKIATLSRGYKRKSKGFLLANSNCDASTLGDEPFQFYKKFPQIQVAVDANRKNGIENLLAQNSPPEVILLDDAFQHRKVKAGYYILLTSYNDLYVDDYMLPTGNLREGKSGSKRADCIIVTKCPEILSAMEREKITSKLQQNSKQNMPVYFTFIDYDSSVYSQKEVKKRSKIQLEPKLVIAGIANPKPFFDNIKNDTDAILAFPDHHNFNEADIKTILKLAQNKKIITTEKDYVRLSEKLPPEQLFYIPIKSSFIENGADFDAAIQTFITND